MAVYPPSYGVMIGDNIRETEASRLQTRGSLKTMAPDLHPAPLQEGQHTQYQGHGCHLSCYLSTGALVQQQFVRHGWTCTTPCALKGSQHLLIWQQWQRCHVFLNEQRRADNLPSFQCIRCALLIMKHSSSVSLTSVCLTCVSNFKDTFPLSIPGDSLM